MLHNDKLWIFFLVILLAGGCAKKETPNDEIPHEELVPEITEADHSSSAIKETSADNLAQLLNEKVGITLKRNPPIYDRIEYVDRNVTELYFFKVAITRIEGLGQLKFLDTIVFDKVSDLNNLLFLTEIPHLKRLFIEYVTQNIDWSFIEQLPDLEVLHVIFYRQPTINIDLKNNKHLEYIGFTTGFLETFPMLLNMPNSLKYLDLEGNDITSLPSDFDIYNHTTIFLGINPFKKDATTPSNITLEFDTRVLEQKYLMPTNIPYISGPGD
jgi:hypothetical protein